MGSSDSDLPKCNMTINGQKRPSLAREIPSQKKKRIGTNVIDPSSTSVEGSDGTMLKIIVTFLEKLSIWYNIDTALKLVRDLIPLSDEKEIFSLQHQYYVAKKLIEACSYFFPHFHLSITFCCLVVMITCLFYFCNSWLRTLWLPLAR